MKMRMGVGPRRASLYGFLTTGKETPKSGLWQNRARVRAKGVEVRREGVLAVRHSVACFPRSRGARFCFSSAHGCPPG